MNFEKQLKSSLSSQNLVLNENDFIANIHERRFNNCKKRQQLTQTFIGGILILMIGFLTVESLEQSPVIYNYYVEDNQEFMEIDTTAYFEDMALILIDSDGDIYETATFLYELDIDLLNQ